MTAAFAISSTLHGPNRFNGRIVEQLLGPDLFDAKKTKSLLKCLKF